jgi:hypothetical protein
MLAQQRHSSKVDLMQITENALPVQPNQCFPAGLILLPHQTAHSVISVFSPLLLCSSLHSKIQIFFRAATASSSLPALSFGRRVTAESQSPLR